MVAKEADKFYEQAYNVIRIIKYGKREQAFFIIGFLFLLIPTILPIDTLLKGLFPQFEPYVKWLYVVGLFFLSLGVYQVWKKAIPHEPDVHPSAKPSVIKGPLSFGEHDGEIFAKLGREKELGILLNWSLDNRNRDMHLVALKGESGAGKTSLLRAGLVYALETKKDDYGLIPIYWEATPKDPDQDLLRTIRVSCPEQTVYDLVGDLKIEGTGYSNIRIISGMFVVKC